MYYAILTTIGTLFLWAVFGVVITALGLPDVVSIVIPLIATSIWAGFDAHKIEFKKYKTSLGSTVYGGGGVFAAVLLLWIIFFPWYLYSRGKILSGRSEPKDEYKDEIMEEDDMTREDAITVLRGKSKKKNSCWWGLGIITIGLIFFFLFFRIIILSGDFTVIAKKHPTFSDTFVDREDFIERYNKAIEKYNSARFDPARNSFETYLRSHAIDPALCEELCEKGIIVPKEEDVANE